MSNSHLDETLLARYAAGLPAPGVGDAEAHLASCTTCRTLLDEYRTLVAHLSAPAASPAVVVKIIETIQQRVRLRQFVLRLAGEPSWREQVAHDPQLALERHRIHPTPQLVAALRELSPADDIAGDQLDERISKLAGLL